MIELTDTFGGSFPFAPRISQASGFRMHYVDEGNGKPILMLHGQPTWGYLFRNVIPKLSRRHRVVAPDYMGFGKSETPADQPYTTRTHIDHLERLVLELDLSEITLVMHDWGGIIGGGLAVRQPDRIARLVVTNTMMPFGLPIEASLAEMMGESEYFRWIIRLHQQGALATVLGELGTIVLSMMKRLQGFERSSNIDDQWIRAYSQPFETTAECAAAIAFPTSVVTNEMGAVIPDPPTAERLRSLPATCIYGMNDKATLPKYMIPCFEAAFPNAPVHRLENAGHFLYEDEPEKIAILIEQFIDQN